VLDQQHGMAFRQFLDQRPDDVPVRLGEAGERLVQSQQLAIDGQGDGHLKQPLGAVRKLVGGLGWTILLHGLPGPQLR